MALTKTQLLNKQPPFHPKRRLFISGALSVAFGAVVGAAEHLAIGEVGGAAAGPGGDVVGVHLQKLPDAHPVGVMPDGAVGTIGDSFRLRFRGLRGVNGLLRGLVEDADI